MRKDSKRNINLNTNNNISSDIMEIEKLESKNLIYIKELEKLNKKLNELINKEIPKNNKNKPNQKNINFNNNNLNLIKKEKIISLSKKKLNRIINEYNRIYTKFSNNTDTKKDLLLNKISQMNSDTNKILKSNRRIKKLIQKNDDYLKNTDNIQNKIIINIKDYDIKKTLFKNKINFLNKEINRKEILYDKENKKIFELNLKFEKFKEILFYYDKDNKILDKEIEKKEKNKNLKKIYEALKRKLEILKHKRESMKKGFENEINEQKKIIEKLKKEIIDCDLIINEI